MTLMELSPRLVPPELLRERGSMQFDPTGEQFTPLYSWGQQFAFSGMSVR